MTRQKKITARRFQTVSLMGGILIMLLAARAADACVVCDPGAKCGDPLRAAFLTGQSNVAKGGCEVTPLVHNDIHVPAFILKSNARAGYDQIELSWGTGPGRFKTNILKKFKRCFELERNTGNLASGGRANGLTIGVYKPIDYTSAPRDDDEKHEINGTIELTWNLVQIEVIGSGNEDYDEGTVVMTNYDGSKIIDISDTNLSLKSASGKSVMASVKYIETGDTSVDVTDATIGGYVYHRDYDGDERVILLTVKRNGIPVRNVYTIYTEAEGALKRMRVTEETYDSAGTKRFRTWIYGMEQGNSGEDRVTFVVEPDGVVRYLQANADIDGVDKDDPGETEGAVVCDLDNIATVANSALDDYASVTYTDFDDDTEDTSNNDYVLTMKRDCSSCGGAGQYTYSYGPCGFGDADDYNRCILYRRIAHPGGLKEVEFYNKFGFVVFDVDTDGSNNWVTHYKYETTGGEYVQGRMIQKRLPSACTGYGVDVSGGYATAVTPNDSGTDGLMYIYKFGTPDSDGYIPTMDVQIQKGAAGTAYFISATDYLIGEDDPKYLVWKTYTYPSETATRGDGTTTTYSYDFYTDTEAVEFMTVTNPIVTTANHGSNVATTTAYYYYRELETGNKYYNAWTRHEDGTYSYTAYGDYDQLTTSITAADETDGSNFPENETGWDAVTNALSLTTIYTHDNYGRVATSTAPSGAKTLMGYCSVYDPSEKLGEGTTTRLATLSVVTHANVTGYTDMPVSINVTDMNGRTIVSVTGESDDEGDIIVYDDWKTRSWVEGTSSIEDAFDGTLKSRTNNIYADNGELTETRRYHDIPSNGNGTLGTNYYSTSYEYDSTTGRLSQTIRVLAGTGSSSANLITKNIYDNLGRVKEVQRGVSSGSLVSISKAFYDESTPGSGTSGVGDGHVTSSQRFIGAASPVTTENYYDYRGRLRGSVISGASEVPVYAVSDYDNMGKVLAMAEFTSALTWTTVVDDADYAASITTSRRSLSTTEYDQRGQAYESTTHEITSGATTANSLTTGYWYDDVGRLTKTQGPTGLLAQTTYDGAGRAVASYTSSDSANIAMTYTEYDSSGRAVGTWQGTTIGSWESSPSAPGGDLVKVSKIFYDVDCSGGGSDYRPYVTGSSSLLPDDTPTFAEPTKFAYDTAGRRYKTTSPDPDGEDDLTYITTELQYDDLGRVKQSETKIGSAGTTASKTVNTYNHVAAGPSVTAVYDSGTNHIDTTYTYDIYGNQAVVTARGVTSTTEYDVYGNVVVAYSKAGTTAISASARRYDHLGRVTGSWQGTTAGASAARNDPNAGTGGDMVLVSKTYYDSGHGSGTETGRTTGSESLEAKATLSYAMTEYEYDDYGRQYKTIGPEFTVTLEYDDEGRNTVTTETLSGSATIVSVSEKKYDESASYFGGLLLSQTCLYKTTATSGTYTSSTYDYGHMGRVCKVTTGNKYTKTKYADNGQVLAVYAGVYESGDDPKTVVGDKITSETTYDFDDVGRITHTTSYERTNSTSKTGALSSSWSSSDSTRKSIVQWYDDLGRSVATANYGTATPGTYSSTVPTSSSTVSVFKTTYDTFSRVKDQVAPDSKITRTLYDDDGRQEYVIKNYTNFVATTSSTIGGGDDNDEDSVTKFVYSDSGYLQQRIAMFATTAKNQTTEYVRSTGDTDDSLVPRTDIVVKVKYPDTTGSTDSVTTTFYPNGVKKTETDQRGVVHTFTYNDEGRLEMDAATTIPGGVDNAVKSIVYAYDSDGRRTTTTSYPNNDGTGTIVNQVLLTYDDWGNVTKSQQSHSGAVDGSTPAVEYGYEEEGEGDEKAHVRLINITYPNGRKIHYEYASSGDPSYAFSRVTTIRPDNGSGSPHATEKIVEYSTAGAGTVATKKYYHGDSGDWTGVDYSGSALDQFGRIATQKWTDYDDSAEETTTIFEIDYAYDLASNRTVVTRDSYSGYTTTNVYDGLGRLKSSSRPGSVDADRDADFKVVADADDRDSGDHFGSSVDIDGDTMVVGANEDDEPSKSGCGAAYVFRNTGGGWKQIARLTASDADTDDSFGHSVGISGDYIVVGAYHNDSAEGAAYVFKWDGDSWDQTAKLTAGDDADAGEYFGHSAAIDGNTIIIGSMKDDDKGAAYVFTGSGSTWTEQARLTASDGQTNDYFSHGVAIDGDTAVIGAYGDDDAASQSGAAYIFTRSGTTWTQDAKLKDAGSSVNDVLGVSVAISGDVVLLGSQGDDVSGNSNSGSAYIFRKGESTWSQEAKITASDIAANRAFGNWVSLSGNTAVVAQYYGSAGACAYVFKGTYSGSSWSWTEQSKITAGDGESGDTETACGISGQTIAVAAVFDDVGGDTDAGSVCVTGNILGGKYSQTWTYGETGNHEAIMLNDATLSFEHDESASDKGGLANEITDVNGDDGDVSHDGSGNMSKVPIAKDGAIVGHRVHTYDAWGRLVKIQTDDATPLTIAVMKYDGLGRRTSKVITNSGDMNGTSKFFYDGQQVIETHNGSDQAIKHNVWGPTYVDELVQTGTNTNPSVDDDMDDFHVILDDANFNIIGIMDDSHDLIERREYHAYGKRQVFVPRSSTDAQCSAEIPHPTAVEISGSAQSYAICEEGHQGL
ncbi:MAG: hypothetical protein GY794_20015, partial [bacterium]|nr:hypothetical protein [bacterium]